jgi:hypothetical protein
MVARSARMDEPAEVFEDQSAIGEAAQIEGHHAAAAIAVGGVAHHALALGLAAGVEGERLVAQHAVVGDVAAAVRSHQAQHALGDDEEVAVDAPQRDQLVDDAVALLEVEPLPVVEAGDRVMKSK